MICVYAGCGCYAGSRVLPFILTSKPSLKGSMKGVSVPAISRIDYSPYLHRTVHFQLMLRITALFLIILGLLGLCGSFYLFIVRQSEQMAITYLLRWGPSFFTVSSPWWMVAEIGALASGITMLRRSGTAHRL